MGTAIPTDRRYCWLTVVCLAAMAGGACAADAEPPGEIHVTVGQDGVTIFSNLPRQRLAVPPATGNGQGKAPAVRVAAGAPPAAPPAGGEGGDNAAGGGKGFLLGD